MAVIVDWFRNSAILQGGANARQRQFWWVCALVGGLFIVVFQNTPLAYFSDASYDDAWFVGKAISIASGHWFGPYDQFALMKGPGYPLFLALTSASGMPIAMAEAVLLVLSLGFLCLQIARLTGAYRSCSVIFAVTLWHPIFLTQRVLRDAIYPAEVFLVLGLAISILFLGNSLRKNLFCILFFGIAFAWFWLTREEGVWIAPGLAALLFGALLLVRRDPQRLKATAIAAIAMLAATFASVAVFGLINKVEYGSYELVDFKDAGFSDAMDALYSVQVGETTPYLPVPKRVRMEVYKVSPHFAELRNFFDGQQPSNWTNAGCKPYPQTCGDIAGGWFFWALREGASAAGKFATPATASEFYAAIAAEVRAACAAQLLTCRTQILHGLPPLSVSQLVDVLPRMWFAVKSLLMIDGGGRVIAMHNKWLSTGSETAVERAAVFLNSRNIAPVSDAPRSAFVLTGWYMEPGHGWFELVERQARNIQNDIVVARLESPDLIDAFHDQDAGRQRFRIPVRCDQCTLEIRAENAVAVPLKLTDLHAGSAIAVGAGQFYMDTVEETDNSAKSAPDPRPLLAAKIRLAAAQPYLRPGPWVAALAFIAFIATLVVPRWRKSRSESGRVVTLLTLVFWVLVTGRMLALALVEVSLFPAIDPLYLIPAYYLVWFAAGLSFLSLGSLIRNMMSSRSRAPDDVACEDGLPLKAETRDSVD